ncbi:PqqD family protein [Arthrobacter sp. MYb227]|nr:PqqD family protein [Arthrobacter sp. MYb227]
MHWIKSPRLAVVASAEADRFAILHLDATQPIVLTGTGAAIWEALDQAETIRSISALLADAYEVDPAMIQPQIMDFLEQLATQSLIITKTDGLIDVSTLTS